MKDDNKQSCPTCPNLHLNKELFQQQQLLHYIFISNFQRSSTLFYRYCIKTSYISVKLFIMILHAGFSRDYEYSINYKHEVSTNKVHMH